MNIHPLVLAQITVLAAKSEVALRQTESARAALPGHKANHQQAMRLHKKAAEQARVTASWAHVVAEITDLDDFDERSVPGE